MDNKVQKESAEGGGAGASERTDKADM